MSVHEDHPEGVTYGSRRVARVDAQPPDGGKGPCSTLEGSRISMSDRGIANVSATPAGIGMVGPADRWLLAGARNHRLPYATPSGCTPRSFGKGKDDEVTRQSRKPFSESRQDSDLSALAERFPTLPCYLIVFPLSEASW